MLATSLNCGEPLTLLSATMRLTADNNEQSAARLDIVEVGSLTKWRWVSHAKDLRYSRFPEPIHVSPLWVQRHTARRYYRLNGLVSFKDRWLGGSPPCFRELNQTCSFRGSKSRNKVFVGHTGCLCTAAQHPPAKKSCIRQQLVQPFTNYRLGNIFLLRETPNGRAVPAVMTINQPVIVCQRMQQWTTRSCRVLDTIRDSSTTRWK